ncbi:MAG: hypothetical protein IKN17_06065 [Ruminococcus sp.]|nr:hypothetical protein [Ruminococcus sp.]
MPRYIDAELLTADIQRYLCASCSIHCSPIKTKNSACDIAECIRMIENAPTADVQEVKPGHWIDKGVLENYPRPGINVYHLLCCSECGALHRVRPYCEGGWINASYCPNCSAKMDGKAVASDAEVY